MQARVRSFLARKRFLYDSRMAKQDADDLTMLGDYIYNQGFEVSEVLLQQNEHDMRRARNTRVRNFS